MTDDVELSVESKSASCDINVIDDVKEEHKSPLIEDTNIKDVTETCETLKEQLENIHWSWLHILVYITYSISILISIIITIIWFIYYSYWIIQFISFIIILITTYVCSTIGIIAIWKGATVNKCKNDLKKENQYFKHNVINSLKKSNIQLKQQVKEFKDINNELLIQQQKLNKTTKEYEKIVKDCGPILNQMNDIKNGLCNLNKEYDIHQSLINYKNKIEILREYYVERGNDSHMNSDEYEEFVDGLDNKYQTIFNNIKFNDIAGDDGQIDIKEFEYKLDKILETIYISN